MINFAHEEGSFIPTREQYDLLRAALLSDRVAVAEAFQRWKAATVFDDIRMGTMRMLPMVYRNLSRLGIEDELMPRLKGIYRQVWFRNQLILREGRRVAQALGEAAIPVLLIKGAALVATIYDDPALRPMEDYDLVVQRKDFARAVALANELGWSIVPEPADPAVHFEFQHAVCMKNGTAGELDLHWCSIYGAFGARGEEAFWQSAVDASDGGVPVKVLAPSEQLLQICAHATQKSYDVAPIRWVADAYLILARAPAFDWDRLLALARTRRLSLTMLRCLEVLGSLGVDVPTPVCAALRRGVVLRERLMLGLRDSERPTQRWHAALVWARLILLDGWSRAPHRLGLFRRYLRSYFGVPPQVGLPRFIVKKILNPPVARAEGNRDTNRP